MITERFKMLEHWIRERENIRLRREAGEPKPWTTDPVLQNYRFCNVHREDDKVTRWIARNWRDPNNGHENMVLAMALARLVNWPDSLMQIGFPYEWDPDEFIDVMRYRRENGLKGWTGAYMITAEANGSPKEVSVARTLDFIDARSWYPSTCYALWEKLQDAPRVGSFIAAQIVADVKHTDALIEAEDYLTFCAPGPGSMNGLNWLLGKDMHTAWRQADFSDVVNSLRASMGHVVEMDAQDMQNCLCEVFKYQRGYSRSKYPGV